MELDAALRTQFNVFGLKERDLKKTKHKSEMKKYFEKAGVPVVPGFLVKKEADIEKGVKKLKLPLITKPDNGVGAAKTFKLKDKNDVENFKKDWDRKTAYFLELFVDNSDIVTFDGLIDSKGNIVFSTSIIYYHTPLELLNNNTLDWVYYIDKDLAPKLVEYGKAAVKAFGMKERFFHIEFFKTEDDYIAIEYNNRPAGAFALDVYNYSHSADFFKLYAEVVVGKGVELNLDSKYGLASTRRDYKDYAHTEEEIRHKYQEKLKAVLRMPEAFSELQGNVMYVL
ncbi:ATP-grasp domain-containing protein, partial [Gemella morbillorum]